MSFTETRRPGIRLLVGYAVLLGLAVLGLVFGLSLWVPLVAAILPWALVVARTRGGFTAVAAGVLALMFLVLVVLIVTQPLGLPAVPAFAVASAGVGGAGIAVVRRTGLPVVARSTALAVGASALGGVIWVAVVTAARWIPGAAHYVWAMSGDSANNVLFARTIGYDHGITLGGDQNPVPLTAGLLSTGMASGRGSIPSSGLLAFDMSAFVGVWTIVIALVCLFTGLVAIAGVPAGRPVVRALAGAGASLVPLSWYMVGYPIEYGFLNTHLALVVILAAWIIFLRIGDRPALALAGLGIAGTLTLAIWTPLVLFPAALAFVVVVRYAKALWRTRGADAWIAIVGVLQFIAFGVGVSLPAFLVQSGALANPGGAFPISRWVLVGLVLATVAVGVVVAWRSPAGRARGDYLLGSLGLAAAAVIGWGALLFAARTAPDMWISYYPLKFSWMAGLVLFIVVLGGAVTLVARELRGRVATSVGLVVVAVAAIVGVAIAPLTRTGYVQQNPIPRILAGDYIGDGDEVALRIFDYADLEAPTILWRSGEDVEGVINFWVMQMQSDSMSENIELKRIAYGLYDDEKVEDLCRAVDLMGAPTTVRTADPRLADEVAEVCSDADMTIVVSE